MTDALMLLASGAVMVRWRPCRSREARAPRLAIAMLLLSVAAVWVATSWFAIAAAAGGFGDPVRTCGVLWQQLLAGELAWTRTVPVLVWFGVFPGRAVRALALRRMSTCRLRQLLSTGTNQGGFVVADNVNTPAITIGVLRPRVLIDAGFFAAAQPRELRVVVDHERAHVHGRHAIVETTAAVLVAPMLPLRPVRDVYDCVRRHLEALADDAAVRVHGPRLVGETLARVALAHTPAAGLGAAGDCLWRVRRLVAPTRQASWRDIALMVPLVAMMAFTTTVAAADAASALGPVRQADVCVV